MLYRILYWYRRAPTTMSVDNQRENREKKGWCQTSISAHVSLGGFGEYGNMFGGDATAAVGFHTDKIRSHDHKNTPPILPDIYNYLITLTFYGQ